MRYLAILVSLFVPLRCHAGEPQRSDDQVRQEIIKESVTRYKVAGRPCACPYDLARNGAECGGRSAYSRPGGAAPLCYPRDVSDAMVTDWRRRHGQ